MALLQGIPISDEQCIGDSLSVINNAFLALSSATTLLSASLSLSSSNLLVIFRQLTAGVTQVEVANTTNFILSAVHNNTIVFLNNNNPTTVVRAPDQFRIGHKTTFVQTGNGAVTFAGFNSLDSKSKLSGKYGVADAYFPNSASIPFSGWNISGDLVSAGGNVTQGFPFSLIALPTPGAEDGNNQITLTGPRHDTIYYYADSEANAEPSYMNIFINGYYRTTTDFTKERTGTPFGYRVAGFQPNTTGPQVTSLFVDQDNIYLNIPGFAPEPTYVTLSSVVTPGNSDEENGVDIIATNVAYNGESIIYLGDPDPSGSGGGQAIAHILVSTNGGSTYVERHVSNFRIERGGQMIGYKRAGVSGGSEATSTWPLTGENEEANILFVVGSTPRPTPTPTATGLPPTPTTTPTPTPTPTVAGGYAQIALNADITPGSEDIIHNISFVSEADIFNDTIYYYSRTLQDYQMESPMIVYVNGVRRTVVTFPDDFTGSQFGYRLNEFSSSVNGPQVYGTFAPGRVDLSIAGFISLSGDVTPGNEDPVYSLSIVSETSQYKDTIYYYSRELQDYQVESPMSIYVNGVRRTIVTFLDDFTGSSFGYKLYNAPGNAPQAFGTFSPGRVDLSISSSLAPTPTPMPTPAARQFSVRATTSPGSEDPINQMSFTSEQTFYPDTITFNEMSYTDYNPATMQITLSGVLRATIDFLDDRIGTPLTYRIAGILDSDRVPGNAVLTFVNGLSDLSATNIGTLQMSALSATTTGTEDASNLITIQSTNASYNNDRVYYYPDNSVSSYVQADPMLVYVNSTHRATIDFPEERLGTPFGYSRTPATSAQKYTLFKSGIVNITI